MCFGMRHIEGSTECVAELVVEGHSDSAETGAAEPGAIECFLAVRKRGGVRYNARQRGREGGDAFEG